MFQNTVYFANKLTCKQNASAFSAHQIESSQSFSQTILIKKWPLRSASYIKSSRWEAQRGLTEKVSKRFVCALRGLQPPAFPTALFLQSEVTDPRSVHWGPIWKLGLQVSVIQRWWLNSYITKRENCLLSRHFPDSRYIMRKKYGLQ